MKIVTWNVNGLRSLKIPLKSLFDQLGADIICLQETKLSRDQVDDQLAFVEGYSSYFSFPRYQSGYSGVVTYVADSAIPTEAEEGLSEVLSLNNKIPDAVRCYGPSEQFSPSELQSLDSEGRAVITRHSIKCEDGTKQFAIINVYCPRADPEKPERGQYKLRFYELLQSRAEALVQNGIHVLIVGDINTSHKTIDHCDPGEEQEFSSTPSRKWMDDFLKPLPEGIHSTGAYFVDSFRHFHPNEMNAFTCWSNITGARKTNYGTRIDYIISDSNFIPRFHDTVILKDVEGSDHCPVMAIIDIEPVPSTKYPTLCTQNWPEFVGKQVKILNFLKNVSSRNCEETKLENASKKRKTLSKQKTIISFFQNPLPTTSTNTSNGEFPSSSNETKPETEFLPQTTKSNAQAEQWKNILRGPQPAPLCQGHREPCVLRTVKKAGPNFGRQFYSCARPDGHASNPETRCNHFQWLKNGRLKP